jgi:hypothetical protein
MEAEQMFACLLNEMKADKEERKTEMQTNQGMM